MLLPLLLLARLHLTTQLKLVSHLGRLSILYFIFILVRPGEMQFAILEVHYDNPFGDSDIDMTSGK